MNSATQVLDTTNASSRLGWAARLTRKRILQRLAPLPFGRIVIEDVDGQHTLGAGEARADLHAVVRVHDEQFYDALASGGSVGAAESWVRGEWSSPDPVAVTRVLAANIDLLNAIDDRTGLMDRAALRLLHTLNRNTRSGSRRNIQAHYDLGNSLFEQFLDPSMMYSAAIFPGADTTLEEASRCKLERVCRMLELKPEDHLLEIGTGWGGMAEHAARHFGCRVTTTTISREQAAFARERIRNAGLEDRVTVLERDYRELEGTFDKLVSIEMIEAVGHRFLPRYFASCSRLLAPHGLMLLQSILIPDQRYARARRSVDFIQRYIFPGGFLPCSGEILRQVGRVTDLQLLDTLDMTRDYALTLAEWRRRFHARAGQIRDLGYSEDFVRLWDWYFAYCEGGFRERAIGTSQFLFAKPGWRPAQA
jgi:cyclopropane-fatty-acyl-phospholipid synthase